MIWTYKGELKVAPSILLSFDNDGIKTSTKQPVIPTIPDELIADPNKSSQYIHDTESNIFSVAVENITSYDMHGR